MLKTASCIEETEVESCQQKKKSGKKSDYIFCRRRNFSALPGTTSSPRKPLGAAALPATTPLAAIQPRARSTMHSRPPKHGEQNWVVWNRRPRPFAFARG